MKAYPSPVCLCEDEQPVSESVSFYDAVSLSIPPFSLSLTYPPPPPPPLHNFTDKRTHPPPSYEHALLMSVRE